GCMCAVIPEKMARTSLPIPAAHRIGGKRWNPVEKAEPQMQPAGDKPYLDEQGVRITPTHLFVPAHTIEFRKILSISLHAKPANIIERLMQRTTFQLMVTTNTTRTPVSV